MLRMVISGEVGRGWLIKGVVIIFSPTYFSVFSKFSTISFRIRKGKKLRFPDQGQVPLRGSSLTHPLIQ